MTGNMFKDAKAEKYTGTETKSTTGERLDITQIPY